MTEEKRLPFKFNLQQFAGSTMHAKDVVSAKLASCFITVGTSRYKLLQAKDMKATVEKTKVTVPILGRLMEGNRSVGMKGKGSLTIYHNTNIFTKMVTNWKNNAADTYFDMLVVNDDPTSSVGPQTVNLIGCNMDSADIAMFDAAGEWNEQPVAFTFEDYEVIEEFKDIEGMKL